MSSEITSDTEEETRRPTLEWARTRQDIAAVDDFNTVGWSRLTKESNTYISDIL